MDTESLKSLGWLLFWGGLFFVMMRYGCGAHVHGGHAGHGGHGRSAPGTDGKTRDPVCGMEVNPRIALSQTHAGAVYYFCSTTCQDRFVQAPERYTGSPAEHGGHHG